MSIENLEFRIKAAIDAGNSASTLGDLKTSLKELRDLAAQTGPENVEQFNKLTTAAGAVNDKIKDVRESVQALSGTPMERLGNSFNRLRQSIFEMDLEKFKLSLIGIKDSFIALGGQALAPFKNLGVALSGLVTGTTSLTAAMRALGGAIAATGIGALVVSVGLLVAYWDKLETAGGLVGRTFNAVKTTIDSALGSLQKFAELLGLIGPSASKTVGGGVTATGERVMTPKDKELYETEKRLQEERISRVEYARKIAKEQVDDEIRLAKATITNKQELAKKEEELIKKRLNQETKYLSDIQEMNQDWLKKSVRFNILSLDIPEAKQLDELKKQREDLFNQLTKTPLESRGVYKERKASVEALIRDIDKEISYVERRVNRAAEMGAKMVTDYVSGASNRGLITFGPVKINMDQLAKQADDITLDAARKVAAGRDEIKKLTTDQQIAESERQMNQTQAAIEEQRRASEIAAANRARRNKEAEEEANRKAKENVAANEQLRKNYYKQLEIEIEWNRSSQEIDDMYAQIAQEGRLKTSEEIYAEIDRRIQYQSDANQRAFEEEQLANVQMRSNREMQSELEQLVFFRKDIFGNEFDYRVKIDTMYAEIAAQNASWTSEQIYTEIQRRLQFQIDASEAEKQLNLDKANSIIQTAQYGAQALDGLNSLLFTLDENRRISGEKTEKEIAQRAFKRNKAFGIVNAAINTAAGVTAVLASPTNKIDPSGTLQAIQIGFVVATGLAQIAAIAAQKFDASSFNTGGGNVGAVPSTPEPTTVSTGQFMNVGDFKPGQLSDRRVYVVESDITGVQKRVQVLEKRSKF